MMHRLVAFVEEAAVRALALRGSDLSVRHKGDDLAQAVTTADEAVSEMMRAAFAPRLVEEETATALSPTVVRDMLGGVDWSFIGDPIDGTAAFAGGLPGWGSMICACRRGSPRVGVAQLPAWSDPRLPDGPAQPAKGLLLAAADGEAFWTPTVGGRTGPLRPLPLPRRRSGHVGWNAVAAQHYTLDYAQGFFPLCEGGYVADVAALADGRLEATLFNHKLWDLAPTLPVLEALGFALFRWPDLAPSPEHVADLFGDDLACHPDLWIVARDIRTAKRVASAVAPAK